MFVSERALVRKKVEENKSMASPAGQNDYSSGSDSEQSSPGSDGSFGSRILPLVSRRLSLPGKACVTQAVYRSKHIFVRTNGDE